MILRYALIDKKVYLFLAFLFSCVLLTTVNAADRERIMVKDNPQFIKLLTYEMQNRAFALNSVRRLVKDRVGEPDENMWAALFALEKLNQIKYQPVAEKYGISQDATFFTNTRTWLGRVFSSLFPKAAASIIKDTIITYLEKLEELEELAASEDKFFFRYVVLQEQVQGQAYTLLTEGEAEQAAAVIEAFVVQYQE